VVAVIPGRDAGWPYCNPDADGSRWGRPADAVAGPDGALYVSDDTAGAIYRLVPPATSG
jgi:glucose/arabinose dehydrogenase